jgi:hypothetical protein
MGYLEIELWTILKVISYEGLLAIGGFGIVGFLILFESILN